MNLFDAYTLKARIAPGLLVLLPLVAVVLAWFPEVASLPGLSIIAAGGAAGGLLLASEMRSKGLKLQDELFKEWKSVPTTMILRHRDATISAMDKARYHDRLQNLVPGLHLPDAQGEAASPDKADEQYVSATAWLRERTRDSSNFPIVNAENANYGLYRNLCASKRLGWVAAVGGAIAAIALLVVNGFSLGALAALLISITCVLIFWLHANVAQVKEAAMDYAKALIRAIDAVDKPQ